MKHETALQTDLIHAAEAEGGYGLKLSNRFTIGVLDLLIQLPGQCTRIIECKRAVLPVRPTTPIKVELEVLQRRTLRDLQKAGAFAGWCLILAPTNDRNPPFYKILVGQDPEIVSVTREDVDMFALTRNRGEKWPIRKICSQITLV